jgi:hypothetical protein
LVKRLTLASRGLDATKQSPYTNIFPEGIGYYIAAPLDKEVQRYGELRSRLIEVLTPEDPVRASVAPAIENRLAAFWRYACELCFQFRLLGVVVPYYGQPKGK